MGMAREYSFSCLLYYIMKDRIIQMKLDKRYFLLFIGLLLLSVTQTGCQLLQLPFDLLGSAIGLAGQAAQMGAAAAPYAAPFFL